MSNSAWASQEISPSVMQAEGSQIMTQYKTHFNVTISNITPILNPRLHKDLFRAVFRVKSCISFLYLPRCPETQPISADFTVLS